ncbi:MAG: N-acetylmuramoyl-L-alanine amidase [Deltaproteobacteria bacterium]|nr:N-acetylmuramoyl-L-alanine amidase [Kofleriaceae bacterium]
MVSVAFVMGAGAGCGNDPTAGEDHDDHALESLRFEGEELVAFLAGGASPPVEVASGFRRVGLLWDATDAGALEVRTSLDGAAWSEWSAPAIVSQEEVAHAGHVDIADADAGAMALWLQVRVPAGKAAPTFLVIEPMPDIPAAFDPDYVAPDTDEDTEAAFWWDEQPTPIGTLRVYSRADWGARAPRCASSSMNPVRATIHHTVTPTSDSLSPQARLRQIQAFHQNSRGWCDIGYNYLVSRDGRVWRARGPTTVGAHVANANTGNIGISIIGTYTSTRVTATQMCSTAKLLRRLKEAYGISLARSNVRGHRQYGGTACPGNALYGQIDAILRKASRGCQVN